MSDPFLNLDKVGRPLATIKGGSLDKRQMSIFVDGDFTGVNKKYQAFQLPPESTFELCPNPKTERQIIYITGASGSGKSYYANKFMEKYKKMYPNNPIIIFSAIHDEDDSIKVEMNRIRIDESLVDDPIKVEELADTLCIFDDVDSISNKAIKTAVWNIMNECLQTGRHYRVSMIVTNHLSTAGHQTRIILNESHVIVVFPKSGSSRGIKYLLGNYCGLAKGDLEQVFREKTRAFTIFRNYPMIAMSEKKIWLLSNDI
jgi:adenosyl cobinamide kinase/adenosyl cobinamide phosphate guanylyltransferase